MENRLVKHINIANVNTELQWTITKKIILSWLEPCTTFWGKEQICGAKDHTDDISPMVGLSYQPKLNIWHLFRSEKENRGYTTCSESCQWLSVCWWWGGLRWHTSRAWQTMPCLHNLYWQFKLANGNFDLDYTPWLIFLHPHCLRWLDILFYTLRLWWHNRFCSLFHEVDLLQIIVQLH